MTIGLNKEPIAALGDSWAHACTQRLTFTKSLNDTFEVKIWKSSSNHGNKITFKVTVRVSTKICIDLNEKLYKL